MLELFPLEVYPRPGILALQIDESKIFPIYDTSVKDTLVFCLRSFVHVSSLKGAIKDMNKCDVGQKKMCLPKNPSLFFCFFVFFCVCVFLLSKGNLLDIFLLLYCSWFSAV